MKRLWPLACLLIPAAAILLLPRRPADPVAAACTWFLHRQNLDGSWGDGPEALDGHAIGTPGVTALPLLALMGTGYSHLSKDVYAGRSMGVAVTQGFQWLTADQRADGTFRSGTGTLDQALATLAMSEAYGLTGSSRYQGGAQKALDALAEMQQEDGSWGDACTTAWAGEASKSAEIAGLSFPSWIYDCLRGYYDSLQRETPDPAKVYMRIFMDKNKAHPRLAPGAAWLADHPPDWERQDFLYWYQGSMATFQFDGPQGPFWKKWSAPLKDALVDSQHPRGCWPGKTRSQTVIHTSLATLSLEIYYRYANVLGIK